MSPPPVHQPDAATDWYTPAVANLGAGRIDDVIRIVEQDDNPADISANFARMAKVAAEEDNFDAALKLADRVHVDGSDYEEASLVGALPVIGKTWAATDPHAAALRGRTSVPWLWLVLRKALLPSAPPSVATSD